MTNDSARFSEAIAIFEAIHREDPEARAHEYHERLAHWVQQLDPDASEPLRLAARCQHLRRWAIPRSDYPRGLAGYRRWRKALTELHVDQAGAVLADAGYDAGTIDRVTDFLTKKNLKRDTDVQLFEDAICLVFFETELAEFSGKHDTTRVKKILRKVAAKMSDRGRAQARQLATQLPDEIHHLVEAAIIEAK
jgi:hypothetical protein